VPNTTDNQGCAFTRIQSHASGAATPTPAQAEARNYKLGRTVIHGLKVAIENPRGSVRSGVSPDGKAWQNRMAAHYGEFSGTRGADGDAVDVFVGDVPESRLVWVINQKDPKGGFDEHKVMLGFLSEQQARDAYKFSFDRDWKGLGTIVPATLSQLKWWLKHGNMRIALTADQLPHPEEGTPTMDRVLWNPDATPAFTTLAKALYDIRAHDGSDGLVFDAVTMDDIMSDPDITGRIELDALVVEVGRMQQKMTQVQAIMKAAATGVQPTDFTISDPVKSRGTMQVAVLFGMSDGQTITVWFHNPDTTPNKLTPMDELISWKWMLNKKDVTIVVAPEYGKDMNVREVSRRIMKLVEKNSEGFKRANAKAGERGAMIEGLKTEILALQTESAELDAKIAAANADAAERERIAALPVVPAWMKMTDAELASPEGFAVVNAGGEAALKDQQDFYDSLFQGRLIAVRNALRALGWDGENFGTLAKAGKSLYYDLRKVGAANIVGVTYSISGATDFRLTDDLSQEPEAIAAAINAAVEPVVAAPSDGGEGIASEDYIATGWLNAMNESGNDPYFAAKKYFDDNLQGKFVKTAIGNVYLVGKTIKEMRRGAKSDVLRSLIIPHVPFILKNGTYDGAAADRKDHGAKAFHYFVGVVALGSLEVKARVSVMERENGMYEFSAYGLQHAFTRFYGSENDSAPDTRGQEPRTEAEKIGNVLDDAGSVELDGGIVNIEILSVTKDGVEIDLATAEAILSGKPAPDQTAPQVPAVDTRTPMEKWAAELAPILTEQGFGAYSEARSKIAGDNGLNANEELDLGRLVEGIVGPEAMTLARAKYDPFIQGTKAAFRGDAPIPPEGLSEEQRATWLKGYGYKDGGQGPEAVDPVKPEAGIVSQYATGGGKLLVTITRREDGKYDYKGDGSGGGYMDHAEMLKYLNSVVRADNPRMRLVAGTKFEDVTDTTPVVEAWNPSAKAEEAASESGIVPFSLDQLKMPTAVQLGLSTLGKIRVWSDESGGIAPGWTNGIILDVSGRPKVVEAGIAKYSVDVNGLTPLPASAVNRVMADAKNSAAMEFTPIAFYDNESVTYSTKGEIRTPNRAVILANEAQTEMVGMNRYALAYFVKTYKGCTFHAGKDAKAPVLVKWRGEAVGAVSPIKYKDNAATLNDAKLAIKPSQAEPEPEQAPEAGEAVNLIKVVDDAYAFTQATDRFKEYIADTVAEPDYSMFATAKAMDEAAKAQGATISWDIEDAVMDSVLDDTQGPSLFDAVENDDEPDDEEGEDFDPEAEFDACPAMSEQAE
jgi:Inorganic Pyrophosphatase/Defence against restriction A N-terminal/Large polyvalent protein-associated domain 3